MQSSQAITTNILVILLIFACILLLCDIGVHTYKVQTSKVELVTLLKQNGSDELYKFIYSNGVQVGYEQGYNARILYELRNNVVLIAEPSSAK